MKTTPVHTEVTEPAKFVEEEMAAEWIHHTCGEGAQVVVRTWKNEVFNAILIGGDTDDFSLIQHETHVRRKLCFPKAC